MWKMFGYTDNEQSLDWEKLVSTYSWIKDMRGVKQDFLWHAEGDVEVHTKMVLCELFKLPEFQELPEQEKSIMFSACLLHDVEKRSTTSIREEDGRIISPRHAKKGEYTARTILYKQGVPFNIRETICKLVRHHGFPIWAGEKQDSVRSLIEISQRINMKLLYIISKADMLGRICNDTEENLYKVEFFKALCLEHDCFDKTKTFVNDLARYKYLTGDAAIDYVPFDDTKFEAIVISGLPGAGKDTIIKKHYPNYPVVSIDDIRRKNKISPTDSTGNGQAIQMAKEEAKVYMRRKESFVWNATNITKDMRSQAISLFMSYGGRVKIVYVESPYKKLLKQNSDRQYKVPEKIIDKLISKLEIPNVSEAHSVEYIINP